MTESEIMNLIEEEGVEFIRLQFTDIFGRLKNLAVTPGHLKKKYSFQGRAAFGDRYEYGGRLYLYPDLNTFQILPWRPQHNKVAKVMCDICYEDGTPFEYSSRFILKKTIQKAKERGYDFLVDPECEFFLFHTDENGLPTTTTHEKAGYLDVGPSDFGENARRDMVLMLEEMGFEIESSHHEQAPAQHEIDFLEGDPMSIADKIETFRFAVRSIAKRFGLYATFMPKPKKDCAGSGMHTNITMMKDGKNAFRNKNGEVTEDACFFIGGILTHVEALAAIANPTVNSYKRLLSGFRAPNKINWSMKTDDALVKLKKNADDVKLELRFPDGSSNPYLLLAACIAAGLDGLEKRIDPGKHSIEDIEHYKQDNHMPECLKEALVALRNDEIIRKALGNEFTEIYLSIKEAEWRDYLMDVSDWELDRYLTRI